MPNYRFEFVGEEADPVFAEFEDLEAATSDARRAMAESVMDRAAERLDPTALSTKIYDEAGYHLATVDFADLAEGQASETPDQPDSSDELVFGSGAER